jgi:hypothetical protein
VVRWKEGLLFGGRGRRADADGGRGGDGKEEARTQQKNTGEERGKWLGAPVGWARGGQRRGRERMRGLSGPTHFGPKFETGMSARGRLWIALSVWVAPLGRVFCPRGRVRTRGDHLSWPAGYALTGKAD